MTVRLLLTPLVLAALGITATLTGPAAVNAQIDPNMRDQVIPAAVQIAVMVDVTENSAMESSDIPVGSGTVVSPSGLILTNAHVVDIDAHAAQLRIWEQQAADHGDTLRFILVDDRFLILGSDGASPPRPAFLALVTEFDRDLDLAILQVKENAAGEIVKADDLALPAVALGDSDTTQLGDPIDIFSYPTVGGDSLTYTTGVVSGFNFDEPPMTRSWITTDATLSGGSSGGTAVNRLGELIGVPTQGSALDCRPGDTNLDGELSVADVGCVPVGGSIGQLRPINLARDLLKRAGFDDAVDHVDGSGSIGQALGYAPTPEPPAPTQSGGYGAVIEAAGYAPKPEGSGISGAAGYATPAPEAAVSTEPGSYTETLNELQGVEPGSSSPTSEIPASAARQSAICASSPIYPVGTIVETFSFWQIVLASAEDRLPGIDDADALVYPGSLVRITGPLVERGICDEWPVEVISVPSYVSSEANRTVARIGDVGIIGEQAFQVVE